MTEILGGNGPAALDAIGGQPTVDRAMDILFGDLIPNDEIFIPPLANFFGSRITDEGQRDIHQRRVGFVIGALLGGKGSGKVSPEWIAGLHPNRIPTRVFDTVIGYIGTALHQAGSEAEVAEPVVESAIDKMSGPIAAFRSLITTSAHSNRHEGILDSI